MRNLDNHYHLLTEGEGESREQKRKYESRQATRPDLKRKAVKTREILRRDEGADKRQLASHVFSLI